MSAEDLATVAHDLGLRSEAEAAKAMELGCRIQSMLPGPNEVERLLRALPFLHAVIRGEGNQEDCLYKATTILLGVE